MTDQENYEEPEVINSMAGALEEIERASIDIQISTAHAYPRSITTFKERALAMVTLDMETAQSCIYRRPVGKKGKQVEYAEGKSIRMAEIVGTCYGNLRVGSMLVEITEKYVKARGMAHDLESNFAASSEVIESVIKSDGHPYSDRMKIVVAKAALAKARRDATFQVVPGALCKTLEDAARKTAIGTEKTLAKRRSAVLDWINKAAIKEERVFSALGVNGIEDIGLKELETLTGLRTAIKDNEITIDEAFPRDSISMPVAKDEVSEKKEPEKKTDGKFKKWAELAEEEIEDVFIQLHASFDDNKERLESEGIKTMDDVLKKFFVRGLSPKEMTPDEYWQIYNYLNKE